MRGIVTTLDLTNSDQMLRKEYTPNEDIWQGKIAVRARASLTKGKPSIKLDFIPSRRPPMIYPRVRLAGFAFMIVALAATLLYPAESKKPFTIEDYFLTKTFRVEDMTADGRWLAVSISTPADRLPQDNTRYGDPTYLGPSRAELVVIEIETGRMTPVFPGKRQFRNPTWSPDGKALAFLEVRDGRFQIQVWFQDSGKLDPVVLPKGRFAAENSRLLWAPDGKTLIFATRAPDWESKSAALFKGATSAPVIVLDTKAPFLQWDEIRRRGRLAIPAAWDFAARKMTELMPETPILSLDLTKDGTTLLYEKDVTEKTSYDVIGGTRNQLEAFPLPHGPARVLLQPYEQRQIRWARDGKTLAYADKGDVFMMGIEAKEPRRLTGEKESEAAAKEAEKKKAEAEKKKQPSYAIVRFSPDGRFLLSTSTRVQEEPGKDEPAARKPAPPLQYWLIDVRTGEKRIIYELPEEEDRRPELRVVDWSPDGASLYFGTSAKDKYDRGLVRFDLAAKTFTDLRRGSALYGRWQMSEDGTAFVFTESDGDFPDDLYAADPGFQNVRRLTDLNPWLSDKALSHTELISYRDADGKKLNGVLYYPANYEKGRTYPLVTEVYENYFDNGFNGALNVLTSAGYAVLHPSVSFAKGYPGEAWAKGALAAVNKVIELGVADPDRLGIQGTSYGGYATVLLLTQTDRFKAAINNSGKVDMISFYTQSPRLGVRNTHAPEKSQDRIGGTLWEFPERYLAHSAVLRADRITTPLLCITGDQDPNVEALQSQEIYYALRRLGKKCVWLRYHNGAHGGPNTPKERADMYKRMIEWYDTYLKAGKK
jgi:dipeptidyl aminopeptidase/acylaminoacyl peptidase